MCYRAIGILSTTSRDGKVDAAVMGSPRMIDEKTVIIALGKNRTFANLQENPSAVYTIVEPGAAIFDWKGVRVYLRMKEYATSGEQLEMIRSQAAKFIGDAAAKMMQAVATMEVVEVRPIVDMGQGWEKSV